jgi:hypothetical protein
MYPSQERRKKIVENLVGEVIGVFCFAVLPRCLILADQEGSLHNAKILQPFEFKAYLLKTWFSQYDTL